MQRIKTLRRQLLSALTLSVITALIPAISHAAYPEQPIKMVVAYGAGGGTDIIARTMALYISKHLATTLPSSSLTAPALEVRLVSSSLRGHLPTATRLVSSTHPTC